MKRFLFPILVMLALVGCGTLHGDYVAADRANYDAIAPVVSAYINGELAPVGSNTVPPTIASRDFYESKMVLWNARIKAAEDALQEQK